jgi:hypothetical protein
MLAPLVLAAFIACTGEAPPAEVPPVDPGTPELAPPPPFDPSATASENIALVPSVVETQSALEAAGINTKLADLIADRAFDVNNENKDNIAVRTGVVIADMLLTVKTSPKDKQLDQLEKIKVGLTKLDGGPDIQTTVNDIQERVRNDAVSKDDLLKELDELSGAVIPELEFNGQQRMVPLIQAGSWLEGANLVAKAVRGQSKPDAADALLKQPAVVDYFIKYVKNEGQEKAPAAVTQKLEESLNTLKGLAEKKEPLTMEDIDTVIKVTDDVLALL